MRFLPHLSRTYGTSNAPWCGRCWSSWPCDYEQLRAENATLRTRVEQLETWAREQGHAGGCNRRYRDTYPCRCGYLELFAAEAGKP